MIAFCAFRVRWAERWPVAFITCCEDRSPDLVVWAVCVVFEVRVLAIERVERLPFSAASPISPFARSERSLRVERPGAAV